MPRPVGRARVRRRGVPITGRAAVLGLVICVLAVTLAYPARSFLAQRGEISSLRTALHAQQDRVDGLQGAIRSYADPAYVESEARRRLQYQYSGDVVYRLPAPPEQPAQRREGRALVSTVGDSSWYVRLWDSSVRAGRKGAGGVLQPQPPQPGTGGTAPDGPTQPGRDPELPGGTG
ncbi:MAG: FtsB family cell division protein [Frankiaceae bacterium]